MIWDAIVIGGSFAGLSAAMQLARGQRQVLLIDAGEPRNRFAAQAHGFFAADGAEPGELRGRAWQQLLAYPTVQFRQSRVSSAQKLADGNFCIKDETEQQYQAKALILATGLTDTLPDIPGLAPRWGKSVIHCPYCHGYEFRQQPIAVIAVGEGSIHQAAILPDWGPVTYFSQGKFMPDAEQLALLQRRGVTLEHTVVTAVEGEGFDISYMLLADGRRVPAKVVYVAPKTAFGHKLAQQLGCELEQGPTGAYIKTDAMQLSSVAGLFAAGDMASPMHNGMLAAAAGVKAGAAAHRYLMLG
jgi:thioredoxin reductase